MAKGKPALWGFVLGVPTSVSGLYVYLAEIQGSLTLAVGVDISHPEFFSFPLVGFGAFVMLMGGYVQLISPQEPVFAEDEEIIKEMHPTQRVARMKVVSGIPFLLGCFYLLEFTLLPYVYPTAAFVVGLYYLSSGLYLYWRNSLTTYYITDRRVIRNYRFLSLSQKEIPLQKVRGIEEARSISETLLDIGSVKIASAGGGGTVNLQINNIRQPSEFASEIRKLT